MSKLKSRGKRLTLATIVVLAGIVHLGCANIPKIVRQTPLKPGPKCHAVMLQRVAAKLERGAKIGVAYPLGLPPLDLRWQGGRVNYDPELYGDELRNKFTANGLTVVGDPTALFEDPDADLAEFLIGALITDLKVSLVFPFAQYGDTESGSGSAYIKIEWQVFEKRSRSVCLKVMTEGSAHDVSLAGTGATEPLMQAFGVASVNLLAEKTFMDLIAPTEQPKQSGAATPIIVDLIDAPTSTESIKTVIDDARVSVLTIFGPKSRGSGFIVSNDGYLMTNQHVVGDARNVSAETLTGRKIHGEVIRVNRARDVALVKLEKDQYQPLPLGTTDQVRPATEVFAIGSPKGQQYGQSVTRGIVSGFRSLDDKRYLQSDVAINHGSSGGPLLLANGVVIGIAVSGFDDAQGLNFFIPIEEAISALTILDSSAPVQSMSGGENK